MVKEAIGIKAVVYFPNRRPSVPSQKAFDSQTFSISVEPSHPKTSSPTLAKGREASPVPIPIIKQTVVRIYIFEAHAKKVHHEDKLLYSQTC